MRTAGKEAARKRGLSPALAIGLVLSMLLSVLPAITSPTNAGEAGIHFSENPIYAIEIAPDGTVWMTTGDGLVVVDEFGERLATLDLTISAGDGPAWFDGSMYVVAHNEIVEIDPSTYTVTATFEPPAGGYLSGRIIAGNGVLYVGKSPSGFQLDPATGTITELGFTAIGHMAVSPAYPGELFVGTSRTIERWDVDSLPATLVSTSPQMISLRDFVFNSDGSEIWATRATAEYIQVIDPATLTFLRTIPTGDQVDGIAHSPSGRFAASSSTPGWNVAIFDETDDSIVRSWNRDLHVEHGVIAITDDGERVYVAARIGADLRIFMFVPGAPTDVETVAGDGEVEVSWTPADDEADSFEVRAEPGGATCSAAASPCTVDGLTNGVSYTFTVTASNSYGDGPPSSASDPVVPDLVPGIPTAVDLTDGTLTWAPGPGGAPTDYSVTYREYWTDGSWLTPFIVGGEIAPIDRHRHTVKLLAYNGVREYLFECDGVLLTLEWVLTAAHCAEYIESVDDYGTTVDEFVVLYGLRDWTGAIDDLEKFRRFGDVDEIHIDYNPREPDHDIALIRLDRPADARYAAPIPIADFGDPVDGDPAYIAGWGATETDGVPSDLLRGVEVTINESCGDWPELFEDEFSDGMICTNAVGGGACSGDSGGPLVVNRGGVLFLVGIVSIGSSAGCGIDPDRPDLHTRVSAYEDWIENRIGDLSSDTDAVGTSAPLAQLKPGRSYLATITASNDAGEVTGVYTFDMPGQQLLTSGEVGVDCNNPPRHPFGDIDPSSFAYDSVGCIYALGVTTGTGTFTYSPTEPVTRAQMGAFVARFFERLAGEECSGAHPFSDVAPSSFAFVPVGCIYGLGITTGTSGSTYSPGDLVTREQMAAFIARLYRALSGESCGSVPVFVDVPPSSFAYNDVGCIHGLGVTTGTSPTTYAPSAFVTREQMAAFLERLYRALT